MFSVNAYSVRLLGAVEDEPASPGSLDVGNASQDQRWSKAKWPGRLIASTRHFLWQYLQSGQQHIRQELIERAKEIASVKASLASIEPRC